MEKDIDIKKQQAEFAISKKQEAEFAIKQKEQVQRTRIDGLLRLHQSASSIEKDSLLGTSTKTRVVEHLSDMINIVTKDDWISIHPHDAFPNIDIRMLAYECPVTVECPFLLAILKKIGMQRSDYVNYRKRMGMMIGMEHRRKMGKKR